MPPAPTLLDKLCKLGGKVVSIGKIADIYADLDTAFGLMDDAYFDASKEFMSKYTAKALESRVAIYFGDFPDLRNFYYTHNLLKKQALFNEYK